MPLRLLLAVAPVAAALVLGNVATFPNLPWYATLAKPSFTPPNGVFGPAWTLLYILMAVALFRILGQPHRAGRAIAVSAFVVQIALNAAWSWAFFAAHAPLAGLVVIALLDIAVLATTVLFLRLDRAAGICLVPYCAWLAYATALNAAILQLNGPG